jgi:excisionase family DNA binding protein
MMVERLMTPDEVAKALQLHHLTILKFIRSKKLKSIKLGRVYRIRATDLDEFLESQSTV